MLEFDGVTILLEIINFLIIAAALNFLLFKPVVKRAEAQRIERERLEAELKRDREEAAEKLAAINERIANFETELEAIADEMYNRGKQVQEDLLESVRAHAETVIHEEAIKARYDVMIDRKENQVEIVDTVISITSSTLRKVLPANTQSELIGRLVKQVWDLGKSDINQVYAIRDSIKEEEPIIRVSNMQLTEPERGFSFQHDGPLDMRMDPQGDAPTAAEVLAFQSAEALARIFWEYGGERYSRRIAARIESERRKGRQIETTGQLVALIRELLPAPVQRKMGIHPARRVFQALRIFVNDELGELESMLSALPGLAAKGCVVVIVSYHSLEDRIVKHRFRAWEKEEGRGTVLTRRPVLPGEEETERNFKARSAKLRAFSFY